MHTVAKGTFVLVERELEATLSILTGFLACFVRVGWDFSVGTAVVPVVQFGWNGVFDEAVE